MIYTRTQDVREQDFLDLLEKSKVSTLAFLKGKTGISSTEFERIVYEQMTIMAVNTTFEGTIIQTGTYAFPDIVAKKYFGVEVKMTSNDHWTSTGNSVLESSRISDIERIYIVFGKFGGTLDIRFRLYQECLNEVSVTHSPRYRINMDLAQGKSIFEKMGIAYDVLRKEPNSIQRIKDYYRSQLKAGEELWWIDSEEDGNSVSPIIRPFRGLSKEEKEDFIVEAMILFPEMFGKGTTKFERAAAYLIAEHNAVSANLRDIFTAGGRKELHILSKNVYVPQLMYQLYLRAGAIEKRITEINHKKITQYWRTEKVEKDILKQWKSMIDNESSKTAPSVLPSDIMNARLK